MKLFTTALALLRLGPDYRFTTQVIREASGDLVLVGERRSVAFRAACSRIEKARATVRRLQPIEDLADQVVSNGSDAR